MGIAYGANSGYGLNPVNIFVTRYFLNSYVTGLLYRLAIWHPDSYLTLQVRLENLPCLDFEIYEIVFDLAGWGPGVFSFRGYNSFWIYIVGPHIGAILAVGLFQLLLKMQPDIQNNYNNLDASKMEYSRKMNKYRAQPFPLYNEVSEVNASPSRDV